MPVSQHYFVLFHSEGAVHAMTVPSFPDGLAFEGRNYQLSKSSLIDFNHLLRGLTLVGFDFLNSEDGGSAFLSSRFIRGSSNVSLKDGILTIYLGGIEGAESDQGSFMGSSLFESPRHDYIIVLPRLQKYWSHLGFDLATTGIPIVIETNEG
jgi:hypothetical protein